MVVFIMEETITKKTNKIPFIILAIITLLACVLYFASIGGYVSTVVESTQASGGSVTVDFGTITNVLYSTGGMLVIAAAALMAVVLLLKNKRELWAKIFVWAGLLLATMLGAAFFSSLASVATNGFSVLLPYIPQVALVVGSVALIAKWDSGEKKSANIVILVSLIVSIIVSIAFTVTLYSQAKAALDSLGELEPMYIFQYLILAAVPYVATLVLAVYYVATMSRRKFDCFMLAMTDEEAQVVERIEKRVDEIADEVEEMAVMGEAIIEAEKEIDREIDEAVQEAIDEAVEEVVEDDAAVTVEVEVTGEEAPEKKDEDSGEK